MGRFDASLESGGGERTDAREAGLAAGAAPAVGLGLSDPAVLRAAGVGSDPRRRESLRMLARAGGAITVLVALLVIVGWIADIRFLRSLSTRWVSMVFNTAVSFVLLGTALVLSASGAVDRRRRVASIACAGVATLIAILTLLEYTLKCDLGIDRLLFSSTVTDFMAPMYPGRMPSPTAVNFTLLGATILAMHFVGKRAWRWAQVLPITAGYVAVLVVAGYIYDLPWMLEIGPGTTVALHTGLLSLVLAAAVLMGRPDQGLMGVITSERAGGVMARRILPAALIVPFALGVVRFDGQRAGYLDTQLGVALVAVATMMIFSGIICWNARSLNIAADERQLADERCRRTVESSPTATISVDPQGRIVLVNAQTEKLFGYAREEMLGRPVEMLIPQGPRAGFPQCGDGFLADPQARPMGAEREPHGVCKDGTEFPVEIAMSPVETNEEGLFAISAIVDISERKRAEESLRESAAALAFSNESLRIANEELRRKNVELDEFTYVASHDLQEPLRKITAFGELLSKDLGGALTEPAGKDLGFITEAAKRMRTLVQDLLALSRTGRAALRRERVSLAECADQALCALDVQIQKSGAEITRDALPDVLGDPTLLTQMYQNLLGNALKFAEPGRKPEIHLTCERQQGQWLLGVRDNGIGIKPEYHEQIFAPFIRLHGRNEYEGTGIGLSICRRVVERHGGRIWVESEPGRGTHFKFTLNCETESLTWLSETPSAPSSSLPRMIPATKS
jgi:PAS domain S-box-containing protein